MNKKANSSVIYAFDLNTDPRDLTKWLFLSVITSKEKPDDKLVGKK